VWRFWVLVWCSSCSQTVQVGPWQSQLSLRFLITSHHSQRCDKSSRWLGLVRWGTHGVSIDIGLHGILNLIAVFLLFLPFHYYCSTKKRVLGKGNYDPTIHQCMCIWHFLFKHLQWWPKGFASLTLHTSDLQFPSPLPMGSRAQGKYNQEPPRARCGTRRLSQL